ncbi:MAG: methylenetetrahydrofolate reductase, partial [bacterium]
QKNGSNLPVIAGILPVTNLKQLSRMVELSGTKIPVEILNRFESVKNDPVSVKKIGIDIATQMGAQLLDLGVPGLHFYTMNTAESTIEIAKNLGLVKS